MSTSSFTLISSIVEKTFPAISNRVIPLLLLQKDRSPFLGNGRMMPFPHSSGVLSLYHISLHMRSNHSLRVKDSGISILLKLYPIASNPLYWQV